MAGFLKKAREFAFGVCLGNTLLLYVSNFSAILKYSLINLLLLYLCHLSLSNTLMSIRNIIYLSLTILLSIPLASGNNAATPSQYDSPALAVGLMPRTPQQIAAFYEARGFSKPMIQKLKQQCFFTVWIHNKGSQVIWLDLSQWSIQNTDGVVARRDRHYWQSVWEEMQIPLAHQSTFRWTLLPEILDFQPDEREGGNIVLPRNDNPLQIQATFMTQADKSGTSITVSFTNIQCANDP